MHGHGARPWGLLLPESIPRNGLRDLRRELEFPRLAQALSARQLAPRLANGTEQIEPSSRISALRGEATRRAVSFPIQADQRKSWSNLPVALVPRVGINVGALGLESRRRLHDLLRASTSGQGYHKIAAIMRHDDILRTEELEYLQHN